MKSAQDCKPGQILKIDGQLYVITFWDPWKNGDRGGIIVDLKLRNLEKGNMLIIAPRAQDLFEDVSLDRKKAQYSFHDGNMYVFMDQESFEQIDIPGDVIGDNIDFLKDGMEVEIFFHEGRPISVNFPTFVELEITYTENVARGDTSGKVMKKATLDSGSEIEVPSFCNIGDRIKVDTRTREYVERVK